MAMLPTKSVSQTQPHLVHGSIIRPPIFILPWLGLYLGSYKLAVCAKEHGIPVYACVPVPTIDLEVSSGRDIVIEERDPDEVRCLGLKDGGGAEEREEKETPNYTAPPDVPVFNPAFDITPAKFLTGIITDQGICYPPFSQSLAAAVASFQTGEIIQKKR